jgi:hypothetical protein
MIKLSNALGRGVWGAERKTYQDRRETNHRRGLAAGSGSTLLGSLPTFVAEHARPERA